MSSTWGASRGRDEGREVWRGTWRRPGSLSKVHFLAALPVLGSLDFSETQTIRSLFKPCYIAPNLKFRHLHTVTTPSRNNNPQ